MSIESIRNELSGVLSGNVLIAGIGNQLRSDDGFGPALINRIKDRVKVACLDTGSSPENYIGKIVKLKPSVILFIDTVSMNESPATLKLIKEDQIPLYGFSTHNMSPKLMMENIKSQIKTKIFMLGVQPVSVEFGEVISKELSVVIADLEKILVDILGRK